MFWIKRRLMEKLKVAVFLLSTLVFSSCSETDNNFSGVSRTPQEQLAFDIQRIEGYLDENDLTGYSQTSDGIFYKIEEEGNGIFPRAGQTVFMDYLGTSVDRIVFDQSTEGVPFEFVLGSEEAIDGLNLGVPFFDDGASGTLIIPSPLGYGTLDITTGTNLPVQRNSILIFDIKIVALR
jgi:FKBP-type peptidyl-prolyl cis-trans isomerase